MAIITLAWPMAELWLIAYVCCTVMLCVQWAVLAEWRTTQFLLCIRVCEFVASSIDELVTDTVHYWVVFLAHPDIVASWSSQQMFTNQSFKILKQIRTTRRNLKGLFCFLNQMNEVQQGMYGSPVEKKREMCSTPDSNYQKVSIRNSGN